MPSVEDSSRHTGLLLWSAAILIIGSQVAVDPVGWFAFSPIKWMIVSTAALAMSAAVPAKGHELHRATAIGWLLFLGWGVIVSLFAVDPLYTWIGTPDRHLGLMA